MIGLPSQRQNALLSESNAHHCDTCATLRMSRTHGTYVPPSMVDAENSAYVENNKNKKWKRPGVVEPNEGR